MDIIKSVESFQSLKKTVNEQAKQLSESLDELRILQEDNPRILQENNGMHLKLIQDGEEDEQEDANARLELRSIDDGIENATFVLQREITSTAKFEKEVDAIRDRIWESIPHEQHPAVMSKLEVPNVIPSSAIAVTEGAVESLAQELTKCGQDCEDLEIEVDSRRRLLEATREQCSKLVAQVDAKGVSVAALREKAGVQRAEASIAKLNTEVDLLNHQHEALKTQQHQLKASSSVVEQDIERFRNQFAVLQRDHDRWTHQVSQMQESDSHDQKRVADGIAHASSKRDSLSQRSNFLANVNRRIKAKIESVRQTFAIESTANNQLVTEAQRELQVMQRGMEQEQTLFSSEMMHAETRMRLLQQQKIQLQGNRMRLATEVSSEQMALAHILEDVRSQSNQISLPNSSPGVALVSQAEEIVAEIARLESSSGALRSEAETLQSQLQDRQMQSQVAEQNCESLKLQSRHLGNILGSLANTRSQMSEHLDSSLSGAQRTIEELAIANQRGAPLGRANESLRQNLVSCEKSLAIVEDQQRSLQDEVWSWTNECHQDQQRTEKVDTEVQQARAEIMQSQMGLSAFEVKCEMQERSQAEEESKLKAVLMTVAAAADSVERDKDATCAEVFQEVQNFEKSMSSIQTEIVELAQQKDHLVSSCALASASRNDSQEILRHMARRLAEVQKDVEESEIEASAVQLECSRALEIRASLSQRTNGLLEELSEFCEVVRRRGVQDVVLKRAVEDKRLQYNETLAHKTMCSRGMQTSKSVLDQASVECNALQEEVKQLSSLIATLEVVKDQVVEQIGEHQQELEQERHSRSAILEAASACSEKRAVKTAEVEALQHEISAVDGQRDKLQALADEYAEEISSMKTESETLQDAIAGMQKTVQLLRQTIVVQNDQVRDRDMMLASQRGVLQQIQASIAVLNERPFSVGPGETTAILQDLLNMTRENQLLHEDIRVMKQKTDAMRHATEEHALEQQQTQRGLGVVRLEKDDMIRRYQLLHEQTQRQTSASSQINSEQLRMQENIRKLSTHLEAGIANEKQWRQLKVQTDIDMAAIKGQLRSLGERLLKTESAREAAEAVSLHLRQDAALAQRTAYEAETKFSKQEHHAAALGARYQQVEVETRRTFSEVAEARHSLELGTQRQRALEELLLEQQLRSREVERENAAMRRRLAVVDSETAQSSVTPQDLPALRQQLEEQYLVLGDQDATQLQAAAEVRGLREELKALGSAAGVPSR